MANSIDFGLVDDSHGVLSLILYEKPRNNVENVICNNFVNSAGYVQETSKYGNVIMLPI